MLLVLHVAGLVALALYFAQSDLWASAFGLPLERGWPRLATCLAALWPAVWTGWARPSVTSTATASPGWTGSPSRSGSRRAPPSPPCR